MSSDFYLKAQTLYQEFQKKELHYLNAEGKLNDSLMWKKDTNVPLQEYLQKIHQREKKNEEIYQSIMKQMYDLDQHTDLLYSKIEKLELLRNIQVVHSLTDTNYPLTSKYIPRSLNSLHTFNTEPSTLHFESNNLKSSALKSASTQTESNTHCDNCRSLMQVSCQISQIQNSTSSTVDILSVSKDELQVIDSSRLQDDSFSSKNENNPQFLSSSLNAKHFKSQIMYKNGKYIENTSKNRSQISEKFEANPPASISTMSKEKQFSLQFNEDITAENVKSSENKEVLNESQSKTNDSEINVEVSVPKSDADSVNHEFDFLESDTVLQTESSKMKSQNNSKNNTVPLNDVAQNIDQAAGSDMRLNNKPSIKLKNEKMPFQSNKEQEISDNRSETSGSVSGFHSPVISLSDSDSLNEKGSFTASAAYQSLLGNTVMPSKINKQISESESEDEVEKTLARSVQKPNLKTKSSIQPKNDKSVSHSVDSKSTINKQKPVSVNKPQSKLSKSTKKVLGIDTSSSSEIETAVKPPEDKKDEDSDEFDFYD